MTYVRILPVNYTGVVRKSPDLCYTYRINSSVCAIWIRQSMQHRLRNFQRIGHPKQLVNKKACVVFLITL